jgi:hypothetical protein
MINSEVVHENASPFYFLREKCYPSLDDNYFIYQCINPYFTARIIKFKQIQNETFNFFYAHFA